jgi:hypothetical protein
VKSGILQYGSIGEEQVRLSSDGGVGRGVGDLLLCGIHFMIRQNIGLCIKYF